MSYTAWQEPAQKTKVQTIVFASTSADSIELTTYMERLSEIRASVRALKNLRECLKELRTMRDHLETFSSQFAKQCLLEVNEFGRSVSNLLKARTTIEGVCVRDTASGDMVFKMHQHQNTLWRTKELSALGFRHKRKANYFYTKNLHGVRKLAAAKSVRIIVANEQKPRKHQ
jgi:galactokinase